MSHTLSSVTPPLQVSLTWLFRKSSVRKKEQKTERKGRRGGAILRKRGKTERGDDKIQSEGDPEKVSSHEEARAPAQLQEEESCVIALGGNVEALVGTAGGGGSWGPLRWRGGVAQRRTTGSGVTQTQTQPGLLDRWCRLGPWLRRSGPPMWKDVRGCEAYVGSCEREGCLLI